jgi:uncharacterized protein YutE (UPF0331/DUF86 family)
VIEAAPGATAGSTGAISVARDVNLSSAHGELVEAVGRHSGTGLADVVLLNTIDLEAAGRQLGEREVLMEWQVDDRREFEFQASAAFEDFRESELLFLRERAERPYADIISRKLAQLDTHVTRLRAFEGLSAEEYASDWMRRCAIERTLELAIDACIGLVRHAIAERRLRSPTTYADTFVIARDAGLFDQPLAAALGRMCGFRNILAHESEHMDAGVAVDVLRHHLDDLDRAGDIARNWPLNG